MSGAEEVRSGFLPGALPCRLCPRPRLLAGAASGLLCGIALCAAQTGCGTASTRQATGDAARQSSAPGFELPTLDGGTLRLADHLGKDVVLLDFWATWCDPCKAAMPHLQDLYLAQRQRGFVVIGVSIDGPESRAQVRAETARLGVTFPIVLDEDSSVLGLYNPKASAPYSVLISRSGKIISRREGYKPGDREILDEQVAYALAH